MNPKIEHINLHVGDITQTRLFLQTAFPQFHIRYQSNDSADEQWLHFGDDDTYFALYQSETNTHPTRVPYSSSPGFNHLGLVVDDVESLRQRLLEQGFHESTLGNTHPARKRIYFRDPDGNDWEFVEYLSEHNAERNDYSDAE